MRNDKGYRKLIAWQKSNMLAHLIYDITAKFPKEELFSLTYRKHFYLISVGSLTELEFFIDFAYERRFIIDKDYENILFVHTEAARVLSGLLKST